MSTRFPELIKIYKEIKIMTKRFFPFTLSSNNRSASLRLLTPQGTSLAAVANIADDPTPIDQQLADAFNANNAVMAYVLGITNSTLPSLTPQPDWYATFMTSFSDAKIHAMDWTNTIAPNLVAIPTGIANYAYTFNINMMNINSALATLQENPSNAEAKQSLIAGLQTLLSGFVNLLENTVSFQSREIDTFAQNLTADAAILQAAVTSAQGTVGYDHMQVATLMTAVTNLQIEINTWQKVVTGAGIGAGVAFFAGTVVAIFTFGAGLAFGIIGAAAGIATLIAAEAKINQLMGQINQDQQTMTELNQQIASLTLLMNHLNTLITLSQAAGAQIQLVNEAWHVLVADLTTVIIDLRNAEIDSMNLVALQNDLNSANADWQALRSFCLTIAGIQYAAATPKTVNLTAQSLAA